jgi:soluble cytochrome b562
MSRDDDDSVIVTENPGTVTEAQPDQAATTEATTTEATTTEASETQATEQVQPTTEITEPAKPEGPTEAEQAAAFENFKAKVATAVEQVDKSTGTMPDGPVAEVKAAYAALPLTKNKTAARNYLDGEMKSALMKPPFDPFTAKAYLDLNEAVKSTGGRSETVAKPPVDPTEAFVAQVAAHWISTSLLVAGPEVAADYVQKAQALVQSLQGEAESYKAWLIEHGTWAAKPEAERGDEPKAPEVNEVVLHAAKIAQGRTGRTRTASTGAVGGKATKEGVTYSGPRRDVKAHIKSAFEGKPVGTFLKIGDISKHTSEAYGNDHPSGGAINAALDSAKFALAVPNIRKDTEGGVNGARKIAE